MENPSNPKTQRLLPLDALRGLAMVLMAVDHANYFVAPHGTGIPLMYVFCLFGLVLLYPVCLWYGRFKSRKPQESFWRFF
jgi:uncharacterized membrane protein